MPIPNFLLERIKSSAMSGSQVAGAFAKLADVADHTGLNACAINIEYAAEGDAIVPGELVPSITLAVNRRQSEVRSLDADTNKAEEI